MGRGTARHGTAVRETIGLLATGSSVIEYALKLFDKLPEAKSQRPEAAMVTSHGIVILCFICN